jgi:hypothetical protein
MGVKRRTAWRAAVLVAVAATATGVLAGLASGDSGPSPATAARATDLTTLGRHATLTTIFTATSGIEGLTGEDSGNVYVAERGAGSDPCPVVRIATASRIPAMANSIGVGRQNGSLQGVTPDTPAVQNIVANGIVVTRDGNLVVADTARGALWDVRLDSEGRVASPVGCDETFTADTLCLDAVRVEHPALEGADGIALDAAGRIWVDANERNTIAVADQRGGVTEFFRNPVDPATSRRNDGPLEFPTSPVLLGRQLCTTSSDGSRRDNFPNTGGEVVGTGKISCLDQPLNVPGVPLPVR